MAGIRTGRASASVLDNIRVPYYGNLTPLNQLATLSVPEPRLITIKPWEDNLIGEIEKAIRADAKLGCESGPMTVQSSGYPYPN